MEILKLVLLGKGRTTRCVFSDDKDKGGGRVQEVNNIVKDINELRNGT